MFNVILIQLIRRLIKVSKLNMNRKTEHINLLYSYTKRIQTGEHLICINLKDIIIHCKGKVKIRYPLI